MCGIAGIITYNASLDRLTHSIQSMQASLSHRGPDDAGIYVSSNRQIALAHTRLSILDLSPAGHQPMSTPDGRYHITFNGEIYNFEELRAQLQGETFQSQTDTEVILKLYQRVGAACVKQLRGMFAFAIWDDFTQTCFIARDPLGIKPLYYWQSGSTLVFASELRAVLSSHLPKIKLSPAGLYGYLTSGSVPEPHTLIEDVYCLPAGNWLQWQAGEIKQQQYWQISFGSQPITPAAAQAQVRTALIDSVQHHFISDVPVGIFLSGGIDSTSLVALARQTQSSSLQTYSIAFEDQAFNEGTIAQKTAQHFETEHTEHCITAAQGRSLLPQFLARLDQPSIDGFNTFCVSQIAHQQGAKVVLSGLGGDELFGGYKSFQQVPQMVRLSQRLKPLRPLGIVIGQGVEKWGTSARLKRIGDFLQSTHTTAAAYRSFRGIFSHQEACTLAQYYLDEPIALPSPSTHCSSPSPSLEDEVSRLELTHYMRNQLLRDSDVMSMAWGLELRVPLVDVQLIEAIANIPSAIRLAPGKQLLREAIPELPQWVLNQPKRGFSFPFQTWFATDWQDYFPTLNYAPHISLDLWYRRWSLAILHHWWTQIKP
jgi:asparagine synthase (glutamine-hydrolysing)